MSKYDTELRHIKQEKDAVGIDSMHVGNGFIYRGDVYIKGEFVNGSYRCPNLTRLGTYEGFLLGAEVTPIKLKITYER